MQVLIEAVLIPKNPDIEPVKALATFEEADASPLYAGERDPAALPELSAADFLDFLDEVKQSLAEQLHVELSDLDADQFFYRIDRK